MLVFKVINNGTIFLVFNYPNYVTVSNIESCYINELKHFHLKVEARRSSLLLMQHIFVEILVYADTLGRLKPLSQTLNCKVSATTQMQSNSTEK